MQVRRGARLQLDYLYADIAAIEDYAHDNPEAVIKLARLIKARLENKIEPMLYRADPTLEERVKALEDAIAEMRQERI